MAALSFTTLAYTDLVEIHTYVARDSPGNAAGLIDRLERTCLSLAEDPGMGRARPEFGADVLSFPVAPYLIYYRRSEHGIQVLRVLHGARSVEDLLS